MSQAFNKQLQIKKTACIKGHRHNKVYRSLQMLQNHFPSGALSMPIQSI